MASSNNQFGDAFPFNEIDNNTLAKIHPVFDSSNSSGAPASKKSASTSTPSTTTTTSKPTPKTKTPTPAKTPAPKAEPPKEEPPGVWEFLDPQSNQWTTFDTMTQRLVEASCKRDMQTCSLNHGNFAKSKGGWLVDYGALSNTERATGTSHQIKRTPPWKGKFYGAGQQQRKNLMKSDELKKPHFEEADANLSKRVQELTGWTPVDKVSKDDICPVCMSSLHDDDEEDEEAQVIVKLSRCNGHFFHKNCITHCGRESFVLCPICGEIYGTRIGTMPKGTMNVNVLKDSHCAGQEKIGVIQIQYSFPDGTQGAEHPAPGTKYTGTSRTCYLPDDDDGREILALFRIAWERRLLFKIGTSVTTGTNNTTVWNDIHQKTSLSGGPTAFGYPDPGYKLRVMSELQVKGVTPKDLKK